MEMETDKRGRVRKKSAKAREMEEFEEEEKKHGGKKPAAAGAAAVVLPVPKTPPTPTKKAIKVISEPVTEINKSPVSKGVTSPTVSKVVTSPAVSKVVTSPAVSKGVTSPSVSKVVTSPAVSKGVTSPAVNPPVSPQTDPQAKGSVIKLLLSSPVQQSPPPGAKSAKKDVTKISETKTPIKGKKLLISDSEDVSISPLKLKLNVGAGTSTTQFSKDKNTKVAEELPPLSVDTNVQSETIGDEGSLKMKFILSPKEKNSDSLKKGINVEQSSNQGLLTMLKSGSGGSGEKRKILKTKRTDIDSETNEVTVSDTVATTKVVKKAVKRKAEQTVIVKTNPSSSVEYSLPADQNLDYMDLSSFDFDEEGELIISEDNKTKKLTKKSTKSSPKKTKQSADNEFSLDDSQLVSSDVAELAKRVKTAVEKKMGKKVKKGKGQKEEANPPKEEKKKRAPTAYLLWCHSYRHKVVAETPGADFIHISKRLGELWQNLPEKEKLAWRNKAKKNAGKGSTLISTGKTGGSRTGPPPCVTLQTHTTTTTTPTIVKVPIATAACKTKQSPEDPLSPIKGFGTEPVDVAAHLKLVGESLCIIGVRLQEHRGLIAVQGSLSVLLDSMLCALGPLMCLTQQLPELNGCPKEVHAKTLDNVAYIMPGL